MHIDTAHFDRDLLPPPPVFEKFPALGGTERSRKTEARNKARNISADPGDNRELRCSINSNLTLYPDRVILTYSNSERGMVYYLFDTPASAIHHVCNSEPQPRFFYMVEPDRPVRIYFDMERPRLDMSDAEFFRLARRVAVYFTAYISAIHAGAHRNDGASGQWHFYNASTADKLSMHAHGAMTFLCVKELRRVVEAFHELLRWMAENDFAQAYTLFFADQKTGRSKCIVDPGVYSDGRAFRLPFNSKWAAGSNPLMPVMCEREMSNAEHVAAAFIHPNKLIHLDHCAENMVPPCPDNFRNRAFNFLTSSVQWPVPDCAALDRAMHDFALVCHPELIKLNLPVQAQQWNFGGEDHYSPVLVATPDLVGVHPPPKASPETPAEMEKTSVKRSQWLAAMVAVLQCPDASAAQQRMQSIASASFVLSVGTPSWKQRMSMVHVHTPISWTGIADSESVPCDPAAEIAFGWLYLRLLFSDRYLSVADGRIAAQQNKVSAPPSDFFERVAYEEELRKAGPGSGAAIDARALRAVVTWNVAVWQSDADENGTEDNCIDQALRKPLALDIHETMEKYELFRKLPGNVLFTPSQLVTLDKIARLAEHDPLSAAAPQFEPALCAAFGEYCMW